MAEVLARDGWGIEICAFRVQLSIMKEIRFVSCLHSPSVTWVVSLFELPRGPHVVAHVVTICAGSSDNLHPKNNYINVPNGTRLQHFLSILVDSIEFFSPFCSQSSKCKNFSWISRG